jgi:hypothetical protein
MHKKASMELEIVRVDTFRDGSVMVQNATLTRYHIVYQQIATKSEGVRDENHFLLEK